MTSDIPQDSAAKVTLPSRLDLGSIPKVASELNDRRGMAIDIDAGAVRHLGALGLQLLLSAEKEWCAKAIPLRVVPRSAEFDAALRTFGATLPGERSLA